ncbi:MAG: acyltransferase [Bacteroidia bacterium]
MLQRIFQVILRRLKRITNPGLILTADPTAQVRISPLQTTIKGSIYVGKNSTLTIEDGVTFRGSLHIGEQCKVFIGKGSSLDPASFYIGNGSEMHLSPFCVFNAPPHFPGSVRLEENCKLTLSEHVRIQAEIVIRFGGFVSIGTWSSINYLSEIRCDERVQIGSFCLISYEVCIYDTNTHSTGWKERRERIPLGASEKNKPATSPVNIGDDVWIGKGATILKGVTIGNKSIVGIRTVIGSGNFPDESRIVSPKPVDLKPRVV